MSEKKMNWFDYKKLRAVTFERDGYWIGKDYLESVTKESIEYGKEYWEKYKDFAGSDNEKTLNELRYEMVKDEDIIYDIGVGNLSFINLCEERGKTVWGFDVNEIAVKELKERNIFKPLYGVKEKYAITSWDSIEHMQDVCKFLDDLPSTINIYLSIPIIPSVKQYMNFKHHRPNEHQFLCTMRGLKELFDYHDYEFQSINNEESKSIRQDIWSFHFQKR